MDTESVESVEDNEQIKNVSVPDELGNFGQPVVPNDGSRVMECNDNSRLFSEIKGTEAGISDSTNLLPVDTKPEVSSYSATPRRGHGLKKWKRTRRDVNKGGSSTINAGKMMKQDSSNSGVSFNKRIQVYAERSPKSQGSASSTNAVLRNLDGSDLPGDFGFVMGSVFDPGTKLENCVDRCNNGKKAKGKQIKIEKENSHSSMESDLQSSNFIFMQGNGTQSEKKVHCNEENGDKGQSREHKVSDGVQGGYTINDDGYKQSSDSHGSSTNQDPLVEPISALQSVQEALQKELLKLKEISKDVTTDDLSSDLSSGEGNQSFSRAVESELVETASGDVETELEDMFKQKIEVEMEYLAISRTVQRLRVAAVTPVLEEQKALASDQIQIVHKLENIQNKAAILEKEAKNLETISEDIAVADETLKLQKRVCKYISCFFLQLALCVIVLAVFVAKLSPNYTEVVPT